MIQDKVVIVTGGAGLLGRQFCKAIAEQKAIVVIADLNLESCHSVAEEIQSHNGRFESVRLDITNKESIVELINYLAGKYSRIDAVVNNAYPRNKNYGRKLEDVEYEDFCANSNSHLGGYFLVSQQMAGYFQKQGYGNIINMSSIYGVIAPRFDLYEGTEMTMPVEYATIKSGVIHLTKYFAQYYKKRGIRCNSISPGGIFDHQSPQFLMKYNDLCGKKGMLDKEDIIGTLLFLLSDDSKYINGQNFVIDDGFTL
ncbi:oxidoreductase [Leptospira kanakyensis]|uniref:oxidoreductase n=1 Tax=Leptospira kanakyensis TaxID=2484968 RepID=UPI00223D618D|nr:oxidoreductase [Leptospira kanakyensis]MCW7471407.1 oxidoreductase [Leptospira kanakyensis]